MIQISDIKVFLEVVGAGSFTAAASALGLPKSSVARQIARLEGEIGCELLARTTRTVTLTDEGRTFLPHARRLLDDSIEAAQVLSARDGASGLLSVAAPSTFGRAFLAPHLPAFRKMHPQVRVNLRLSAAKVRVAVGEADVAVRLGPVVEPELGVRRLGQIDYWLVAAPAYLASRTAIASPLDLAQHDLIELRPPASDNRLDLHRDGKIHSVRCVPAIEIDDPESVKAATLAGGGVATLPTFLVAAEVARGALVRVLDGWAPAPAPISVLYATKVAPPLRVRAYVDFLFDTIGASPPWAVSQDARKRITFEIDKRTVGGS